MKKILSLIAVVALLVPNAGTVAMQRVRSAGAAAQARMQQARKAVAENTKKLSEWTGDLLHKVGRAIGRQRYDKIAGIITKHKKKAAGITGAVVVLSAIALILKMVTPDVPDLGGLVIDPSKVGSGAATPKVVPKEAQLEAQQAAQKWRAERRGVKTQQQQASAQRRAAEAQGRAPAGMRMTTGAATEEVESPAASGAQPGWREQARQWIGEAAQVPAGTQQQPQFLPGTGEMLP